jgi:hypothetical protein
MKLKSLACVLAFGLVVPAGFTQTVAVTSPKQYFGFHLGEDYTLANYQQLTAYWAKLERESERMKVVKIGVTEEGRDQRMAIVTSPANHRKLEYYRQLERKLALAEGVSQAEARKLSLEGKAVVWIDAGLHATETLCAQMLMETVYQMLDANDAETLRILEDVIILFVHANPDGMDLVADWYMKEPDPRKRSFANLPRLYQKYIGHDNNRDFYANTQAETKNMNRVLYHEWFPQIVYNHHQAGPLGTVLFVPPFRDPFNYNISPLVINGIDAVGAAMMQRFLVEGKPGATTRSGAPYSTWFNGGLRTTTYFHNMIGLLSETIGHPTPMQIPFRPALQLPRADYLAPIAPQVWRFRQSVDYSVTANKAVLDYASRHREQLLYNIWHMGNQAIEHGKKDHWTITPKIVAAAPAGIGKAKKGAAKEFERYFRDPAKRDARGYILPATQPDFLTATKFVNTLLGTGIKVQRAKSDFKIKDKEYPKGSYVIHSAQAFRAHLLDMMEPQDHPNDFAYPGAPPTTPYDSAGYTLALQMGVKFDRILDGFEGPFEDLPGIVPPPPAQVHHAESAVGFFLSSNTNDAFRAVNQLLKAGEVVRRLKKPFTAQEVVYPPGTFFIPRKATTLTRLERIATELGTGFVGSPVAPKAESSALPRLRIALWDRYGGSMPSGWTRWLLERFEFPFQVVTTAELDEGNLRDRFDVVIFPDGATTSSTATELRKFLNAGGTVLAVGSATVLADTLGLPIENQLRVNGVKLTSQKYYIPTSILRAKVNPADPLAWGMGDDVDVTFANSPTFRLPEEANKKGLRRVAWYDTKTPLRSGWAWGQHYLESGAAIVEAAVGRGKLVLYGPQITFRAQPHGTFKFLFNGILQGKSRD